MAVTSLWHVKGSIKDVIDYIENPEKTVPNQDMQDFFDVFSYMRNPSKTNEGEYVSAINCLKETRKMWGGKYQIIVATHLDKGHLHNHFCFNSVSYLDGSKYNYSK